ncbi:MAG: hypothetical protein EOO09_00720 [Chitinophagaceae bacterium]|nr:MAG: hypothetical protein EOO09_00720 [Chitinophagaceae bacterium]
MEIITLSKTLNVFGKQVTSFPDGIQDAYDSLVNKLPGGFEGRPYYGLSYMAEGKVMYYATALETLDGEAELYGETRFSIPEGSYLAITIMQWHDKTDTVADQFHQISRDPRVEHDTWCVEWYKNDEELVCMMKIKS